jgi:type II secretory pathway pseudopilin PulG
MLAINQMPRPRKAIFQKDAGFSLVEVIIAMLVMIIMMMGMLTVFTYAVQYNRGNNLRSQALTVLQREAEIYRSSKFTPSVTDSILLGGQRVYTPPPSADGTVFNVTVTVDNNPATIGTQTSETMPSGKACTLKEIKILVVPRDAQAAWQSAIVTDVTIQRVRGN